MLDQDLTEKNGLEEIGEVIQESQLVITPSAPIVKFLKESRQRRNELFKAGKIYHHTGLFGGVMPRPHLSEDEYFNLSGELAQLGTDALDKFISLLRTITPPYDLDLDFTFHPRFTDPFFEAIENAIEHGTNYCTQSEVQVQVRTGTDGILATVKQPTPGISEEQAKKALHVQNVKELYYNPNPRERRGCGLVNYYANFNARVWFEFYSDLSPEFKVIILGTRERIEKSLKEFE